MSWSAIKKQWMLPAVALACFWGYRYPVTGEFISRHLAILLVALMFLMGVGIGFRRFSSRIKSWKQVAVTMGVCYIASPTAAFFIAELFFRNQPATYTGLILVGTTATTLSTCVIYTRIAGGDDALALWLSVSSSFLCAFVSPILLFWLLGTEVDVPVGMLMKRLLLVMFLPLSAGMLLRAYLGEERVAPLGPILTKSCTIFILAIIIVSVAKGRELLLSSQSVPIICAAAGLHLFLLLLTKFSTDRLSFSRREKIAILFCSSEKTLQIPAYLAIEIFDTPEAALAPVLYHIFQLVIDSIIVSRYSSRAE